MQGKNGKNWGRRFFLILVLIAFVLVLLKFSDLTLLYHNLSQGKASLILLAFIFQVGYYLAFTFSYASAFRTIGIETSFCRLFPLIFSYIFINVVAPTGGISGPALFATEAARRKQSAMKTLAAVLLANIAQFATFCLVLFIGFFYLAVQSKLHLYQIIAAILMLLLTGFLVFLISLGIFKPSYLRGFLRWFYKYSNRSLRFFNFQKRFKQEKADKTVQEFSTAAGRILNNPRLANHSILYAILAHIISLFSLFFVFMAFGEVPSLGVLISGYTIGVLFQIIGITPYGIGLSEGAMTLSLASLGIPTEKALLITLTFRGLYFWIPFLAGFILLRKIHIFGLSEFSIRELITQNKYIKSLKNTIKIIFEDLYR